MNNMLQKTFKVIEYGNFREEPFVFTRTKFQPQAWNNDRPDAPGSSARCVVDELLAARVEARSVSFPLFEFDCLTGRLLNDHNEKFRSSGGYLTFKPFSMVMAHEKPELFVLFCRGEDIRDFLKALNEIECEIEVPAVPLSSANCRLLALPFIYLTGGLDKILLFSLKSDASSPQDGEMMAVLPMKTVIRIADILLPSSRCSQQLTACGADADLTGGAQDKG